MGRGSQKQIGIINLSQHKERSGCPALVVSSSSPTYRVVDIFNKIKNNLKFEKGCTEKITLIYYIIIFKKKLFNLTYKRRNQTFLSVYSSHRTTSTYFNRYNKQLLMVTTSLLLGGTNDAYHHLNDRIMSILKIK